ncbi:gamma-glutamyltransferase [Falsiroseomonas selenitidurans]|uniref:Gamma-glutamyltranspeptidase n=1 Tax=Falsiroseomonas selenitidurans TaxID=2716335 RepID=A0ABX1E8A5_9PROT|nr:gamma-glutamyltransferase [Falsiroseomonas selenitidurans]NKC33000.1 gamma-glutamyltranspeptidase [Falsiroseomonas selenitidurans]
MTTSLVAVFGAMRGSLARSARASHPWACNRPARRLALLLALALPGCGGLAGTEGPQAGEEGFVRGFLGGVAGSDPRAVLAGREVLTRGGSAADAVVAAALMMSVTQPSRAGLGGGGACLVYVPVRNAVEAIVFPPGPRSGAPAGADRPAAVPLMARGLFALHARAGRRNFEELIAPAEQAARFGTEVSRALAADLAVVAAPLLADPAAAAIFAGPGGQPLRAGDRLVQPDLGATLATLRTAGVGDLHQGGLARRLEETSRAAGGMLTVEELREAVPRVMEPVQVSVGNDIASFLPPPADGGLAAAAAFTALQGRAAPDAAAARAASVAAAWRARGGAPMAILAATDLPAGDPGLLPASAGLVALDRDGMAVTCVFTMNNLFGTGRVAPGTGVLLAAAPGLGRVQPALLSAGLIHSPNIRAFRAAVSGSGQQAAPMAVALPLSRLVAGAPVTEAVAAVPEPGRSQMVACPRYLPGDAASCQVVTDPRGAGLALGAVDR